MHRLLCKLDIEFEVPDEEREFRRSFIGGQLSQARVLLALAGFITAMFQPWDVVIDPIGAQTTIWLRMGLMSGVCFLAAIVLGRDWAKRKFESILLLVAVVNSVGTSLICSILAGGYNVVSSAMILVILFLISLFRLRAPTYLLFAGLTLLGYFASLPFARVYDPTVGLMNALQIGTALLLGAISVVSRERSARNEFASSREVIRSHGRITELLHSMLPPEIVSRIQAGETLIADLLEEVSIVFADIVGFTELSRRVTASELVAILNRIFSAFDEAAEIHGMHKIKTIGDAYMAVGGLGGQSEHKGDAAAGAVALAQSMIEIVQKLSEQLGVSLRVRVGVHLGPVVAGVIGVSRPAYDCWGQTVNLASRLESAAAPGAILISETTWQALNGRYPTRALGEVELKGIGATTVFELIRSA